MNPPDGDAGDGNWDGGDARYLGSEPLDEALADRFPFVVEVPGWGDLDRQQRHRLAAGTAAQDANGSAALAVGVEGCRALVSEVEATHREVFAAWAVALLGHLGAAGLAQSPRRARMLVRSAVAVHAARLALGDPGADADGSAALALECGLPQRARGPLPSPASVPAAHKQAWEVCRLAADDRWRAVLDEPDPVARLALGHRLGLGDAKLSRLATRALAAVPSDARRMGLAAACFLAFRDRDLDPSAFEPMVRLASPVLSPGPRQASLLAGARVDAWREIGAHLATTGRCDELERGFLLAGFPDLWATEDWRAALDGFRRDLQALGVDGSRR